MHLKEKYHYLKFVALVSSFIMSSTIQAQFQGDLFFETPSVSATNGETVSFNILSFSGGDVLGAAHFEVSFDPKKLLALDVVSGATKEFKNSFTKKIDRGTVSVVTLNDQSKESPFGTMSLSNIKFKVLAESGNVIPIEIINKSLLNVDSLEISNTGFSGEVIVLDNSTASNNNSIINNNSTIEDNDMIVSRDSDLGRRAAKMRPIGEQVIIETDQGPITVYVNSNN